MTRNSKGQIQSTTICGRRFCPGCGKWRHLLYFRPRRHRNGREYPNSPCDMCHNRRGKRDRRTMIGNRRARRQEYERIYKERLRRERGVPARNLRTRQGCTFSGERVPVAPILPWLRDWLPKASEREFEQVTGISDRTLRRWMSGECKTALLGVLDEVFTKLGHPEIIAVVYG